MKNKIIIIVCLSMLVIGIGFAMDITDDRFGLHFIKLKSDSDSGFLNVNSNPTGLKVYLEGDFIGVTPIQNYAVKSGTYSVSLFSSDTIEEKYWKLSTGAIRTRLAALWDLSKAGAATKRVEILECQISEVFFSMSKINRAPTKAKIGAVCCFGTGFSIAFLLGYLLANIAK